MCMKKATHMRRAPLLFALSVGAALLALAPMRALADEGHDLDAPLTAPADTAPIDTADAAPAMCTYNMSAWHTKRKTTVNKERIEKPYADVTGDERSPEDPRCTVCEQDQATIDPAALGIAGLSSFKVCRHYAPQIEAALKAIAASSFELVEVTGYRPGRTRGKVVADVRTELSNHSYGAAIDINAKHNGLYTRCDIPKITPEAIKGCKLSVGGAWDPKAHPNRSIAKGDAVYRAFTEAVGWKWGGEISGSTRDIMHFSPTGY
jgi:hypothetical protein